MVLFDNVLHDIQTDASARFVAFCLKERIENLLQVFLVDANAIVADNDTELLARRLFHTAQ